MEQAHDIALIVNEKNTLRCHTRFLSLLVRQPAGHPVLGAYFEQRRYLMRAFLDCHWTSGMEAAALRRVKWAGDITLQNNALPPQARIRNRDGRHERLCIWMRSEERRVGKECRSRWAR